MSRRGIVELRPGETRILAPDGIFLVVEVAAQAVTLRGASGETRTVSLADLGPITAVVDGRPLAMHTALQPLWETLSVRAQLQTLMRLEIVLEILTGFRYGFPGMAVDGEPREIFADNRSLSQRCESMARQLRVEYAADRGRLRRVARGELAQVGSPSRNTLLGWVRAFERKGVWGLVDGRARRTRRGFDALDARFKALVQAEVDRLDGDVSAVRAGEIHRRVLVEAKNQGVVLDVPEGRGRKYVSWMVKRRGKGTRAQRSNSFRDTAGYWHYPAVRPGQVIAIDATRVDVLVWDPVRERLISVEVITAIDVATRCVLALRVVPKSANDVDAALLMYDVMRPFSMLVDGTTVSDWRWAGIPEAVTFSCVNAHERSDASPDDDQEVPDAGRSAVGPLQGVHRIPSVMPTAVRCDHGSIFVGGYFTRLMQDLEIELLPSRGKRPTDNPMIERWHETIQDIVQQNPGYKGRSPFERGRKVGDLTPDTEAQLLTAQQLEWQLRIWVATIYHRSWHEGLVLPGSEHVRLTPLELFDSYQQMTGRIDVPQHPDLIYQFLPVKWHPIQQDGVEIKNMTYDAKVLDDFRKGPVGMFRHKDNKAPFFYDKRDVSRIWFRHPETREIHEIPWRGAWRVDAPLTEKLRDEVRARVRARGGNLALKKRLATEQIIRELTQLRDVDLPAADAAMLAAAQVRFDAARRDHLEALLAQYSQSRSAPQAETDWGKDTGTPADPALWVVPAAHEQAPAVGPETVDPWATPESSVEDGEDDVQLSSRAAAGGWSLVGGTAGRRAATDELWDEA